MNAKKTILIAPLNWGLGHATRCIPIIRELKADGFNVIIASDGGVLQLLKKEFPDTLALSLPSYNIQYPKSGVFFKLKLLSNTPKAIKAILGEHKALQHLINEYNINGVISDNRLGLYSSKVPSVYITHQLTVLSGKTTWLSSYIHNRFIKKFDQCWVPDWQGKNNLSGQLGHPKKTVITTKYIGPLSRMTPKDENIKYDAIAVLSGPEPQRTLLEELLLKELRTYKSKVLIVQGITSGEQQYFTKGSLEVVNYLTSSELEKAINSSELVIARSGYTTIMDLTYLNKKAFFIPTPGQTEQEYLAKRLHKKGYAPFCTQMDFTAKHLDKVNSYTGIKKLTTCQNLSALFCLFKGK